MNLRSRKVVKALGIAVSIAGMCVTLLSDWVTERKMEEMINEKVMEAIKRAM